jgi:hypothetical protein
MNARKVSISPYQSTSAVLPKKLDATTKKSNQTFKKKVLASDLALVRDSVLPFPTRPKDRVEITNVEEFGESKQPSTPASNHQVVQLQSSQQIPNPIPRADVVKVPQSRGTPDEHEIDVEVMQLFKRVDGHISDINTLEEYIRRKVGLGGCALIGTLLGTFMVLIGLAATDAFSSIKPNWGIFTIGILFYLPCLIWLCTIIFPSDFEIRDALRIKTNRNYRQDALREEDIRYVHDINNEDRARAREDARAQRQAQIDALKGQSYNPLGYPTTTITRHKHKY